MAYLVEWTTWDAAMLAGDLNYCMGNRVTDVPAGIEITKMSFRLKRVGSPLGNVRFRISTRNQVNGQYVSEFGAIACADIPEDWTWIEMSGSYTIQATEDHRFTVFYDAQHTFPSDIIAQAQYTPSTLDNARRTVSLLMGGVFSDYPLYSYILLTKIEYTPDLEYIPFKGLFIRGDEIQTVFSSPADNLSRLYRSPDFGATWYSMSGVSTVPTKDVGFDVKDSRHTVVGGDDKLYVFDEAVGEVFHLTEGAAISGEVSRIAADLDSEIIIIGTDEFLYKTPDWGATAYPWWEGDVTDVALGGNFIVPSG